MFRHFYVYYKICFCALTWLITKTTVFFVLLLHVSTFLCHRQGVLHLCLAKLHICDFNSLNFKNLCNLASHKCKNPWRWHRYVETFRSNTKNTDRILTLNPLTWKICWAPNNASKWQMGFNSAFEGLSGHFLVSLKTICNNVWPRGPFRTARPR